MCNEKNIGQPSRYLTNKKTSLKGMITSRKIRYSKLCQSSWPLKKLPKMLSATTMIKLQRSKASLIVSIQTVIQIFRVISRIRLYLSISIVVGSPGDISIVYRFQKPTPWCENHRPSGFDSQPTELLKVSSLCSTRFGSQVLA